MKGYEDIAACVTYLGDADGGPFRLDGYMQIRACGTYRCRSQLLTAFSNEGRVTPHVVGMLLTITTLVAGARSVLFLLKRISISKVFRVLGPPLLIGLSLLLAATVSSTTGLLPLLEPRMGMKPTTTERTPPPRKHIFPSSEPRWGRNKQRRARKEKQRESRRERLLRLICGRNQKAEEQAVSSEYWPVKRL
jgi:hypothetical protein